MRLTGYPVSVTSEQFLQDFLYREIPISRHMELQVVEASPQIVRLRFGLEANLNHCSTAFGGSISTASILAAFSIVSLTVAEQKPAALVVVRSNEIEYLHPVDSDFEAIAISPRPEEWNRFHSMLARKGKGRIRIQSQVETNGIVCARLSGVFVAIREPGQRADPLLDS